MPSIDTSIIAKKYALAFLYSYPDNIDNQKIKSLIIFNNFLKKNKLLHIYLSIPTISYFIKQKTLNRIAQEFNFDRPIKKLLFVLLDHSRIEILDKVITQLIFCYRKLKNIQEFQVATSHEIEDKDKEKILIFLNKISPNKFIANFYINSKIICGFRVQSYNFLWERSIAKQLRDIKRSIFKQVNLC